jgi:hypothetical protein
MKFTKGMKPWNKGKKFPQFSGKNNIQFIDLTGQKFGRLTPEKVISKNEFGALIWQCRCDCGNITNVQGGSLKKGSTKSCGCWNKELISKRSKTHGKTETPTYKIWIGIKTRCYNQKNKTFKYYGMRGIKMCPRWKNNFMNFLKDMGNHPKGMSIDRINNDGNYEPNNCRWTIQKYQNRNSHWAKLSEEKANEIKILNHQGISRKVLAKKYKVGIGAIACVLNNQTWQN